MKEIECSEARNLFEGYLERNLSEEDDEAVINHLAHCSSCRKEYGEWAVRKLEEARKTRI